MFHYYIWQNQKYISPFAERAPVEWKYVVPLHAYRNKIISPFAERAPVEWKYVLLLHTRKSKMHIAIRGASTRWMEICSRLHTKKSKIHLAIRGASTRWMEILDAYRHSRSDHPLKANMPYYYIPKHFKMHIAIRGASARWMETCPAISYPKNPKCISRRHSILRRSKYFLWFWQGFDINVSFISRVAKIRKEPTQNQAQNELLKTWCAKLQFA